mmetsp:Transcript_59423/g.191199  ORF Transcript_59423/g.191199 Transcript_59423/m.191199 type:complete len:202 (+) Transcript_59423:697-1302(+)
MLKLRAALKSTTLCSRRRMVLARIYEALLPARPVPLPTHLILRQLAAAGSGVLCRALVPSFHGRLPLARQDGGLGWLSAARWRCCAGGPLFSDSRRSVSQIWCQPRPNAFSVCCNGRAGRARLADPRPAPLPLCGPAGGSLLLGKRRSLLPGDCIRSRRLRRSTSIGRSLATARKRQRRRMFHGLAWNGGGVLHNGVAELL